MHTPTTESLHHYMLDFAQGAVEKWGVNLLEVTACGWKELMKINHPSELG